MKFLIFVIFLLNILSCSKEGLKEQTFLGNLIGIITGSLPCDISPDGKSYEFLPMPQDTTFRAIKCVKSLNKETIVNISQSCKKSRRKDTKSDRRSSMC